MAAPSSTPAAGSPVVVAGGGIGGLAAALTVAKSGHRVRVLERAPEFSEVGAGLQLGPNATRLLRKWGVYDTLEPDLVSPDEVRMMDGMSDEIIGRIPLGQAFVDRFGAPYCVAHRADLHRALHAACAREAGIDLETGVGVEGYAQTGDGVSVRTGDGRDIAAAALIGADGVRSAIRDMIVGDGGPNSVGHTAYRTLVEPDRMPADCAWNAATLWTGPDTHLVHYPVSGGRYFNIVAIVSSDWQGEGWSETADRSELLALFDKSCERVRRILEAGDTYRRWALADRTPASRWSDGRVTLLGDAAHAVLPYMAQGAVMALEDADCLAGKLVEHAGAFDDAFRAYEAERRPRTARLQRESRFLGTVYHARGIRRIVRNTVMRRQTPEKWYDRMSWVYDGP